VSPAEDAAGECEEGCVDVGVALVADPEAPEVVEVGKAALYDSTVAAET
jgi:hypothetical protein